VSTVKPGREQGCRAPTVHGSPCRGFLLPGRDVCLSHAEDLADKIRLARARGGTAAAKVRALQGRRLRLDSAEALLRFNANLCQDTLSGAVDPGVSKAVSYALANQLKLLETHELEQRLRALEDAQRQQPRRLVKWEG
jgi:hypothetical protein